MKAPGSCTGSDQLLSEETPGTRELNEMGLCLFVCLFTVVFVILPPWPGNRTEMPRCFTGGEAQGENLAGKKL